MSVKELREGIENGEVLFGIKQALKKKPTSIFVCKDARPETLKKLDVAKKEYVLLKTKSDLRKELNLSFDSEVFSLVKKEKKK